MKKIYALLICALMLSFSVKAQMIDQSGSFSPEITGTEIAYLEFTFADTDTDGIYDCAIALSQGAMVAYADYSAVIAIYQTGFRFRNSGSFANEAVVIPVPGQVYKFWITFNVPASTYTVDYKTDGVETPVRLATNYGFRKNPVTKIDTWSSFHNPLGEPDIATVSKAIVVNAVGVENVVTTGVSSANMDNKLQITVQDRAISVVGVNSYEVYNLQGMKVAEVLKNAEGVNTVLNSGIYVVKSGNSVRKIVL